MEAGKQNLALVVGLQGGWVVWGDEQPPWLVYSLFKVLSI